MLSLVTDYQWNRKHIFLKSLTLISKLFPYWNKTDPRRVKLRLTFFFFKVRIKVQLGNLFFSRPPVEADKQKYPHTLPGTLLGEILGWKPSSQTLEGFQLEGWANQWSLFLTSVTCGGEPLKRWTKASLRCLLSSPVLYRQASRARPTGGGGTQGRWPQKQVMALLPERTGEQSGPASAASHHLKAAHHLTNITWASTAPCRSPAIPSGWEPLKPCMKIKSYGWLSPANHLPAPPKPWADPLLICQLAICIASSK